MPIVMVLSVTPTLLPPVGACSCDVVPPLVVPPLDV
jgi:hypothetical protein